MALCTGAAAYAQKGGNIQEGSVRAPLNVKIDGKLNEWNDDFQAVNKTTLLTYSITNDDNYLYLVLKTADQTASRKITAGGISFTINTANKKKEQDAFKLVYPMIDGNAMRGAFQRPGGQGGQGGPPAGAVVVVGGMAGGGMGGGRPFQMDSATLASMHKATIDAAKEIKLFGFKDIADSVISVYNEYNIKAAIGYDAKGALTYEMAVPLKSLGLSTDSPKEFAYNIKVNGIQMRMGPDGGHGFGGGGMGGDGPRGGGEMRVDVVRVDGGGGSFGGGQGGPPPGAFAAMQSMFSPTDFWGKYTLAKK
ncbi:DOMON domain-containing protein [Mucilaginibacter mali]|nr:hypothetical protein [Mucilaginibacter mali]